MTKKEWLQALLDGKTVTSNYANGNPIIFYEGVFMYKNTSEEVNLNLHNHGLREYFKYPMWFKSTISGVVVKFTSLKEGIVVSSNSKYRFGKKCYDWEAHTSKTQWTQVDEPITIKEVTIEEIEAHYGCKVKIVVVA